MTKELDPEGTVTRREFDGAFRQVGKEIAELKDMVRTSRPGLSNLIAIGVAVLGGVVASSRAFSRLDNLESWRTGHDAFSTAKSDLFESQIAALQAIAAANREALQEQEMQHRWMADAGTLQDQRLEQLLRLYHPQIPASTYWPLQAIGRATP